MSQTKLINSSNIIPEGIASVLSPEMNQAMKIAINQNIQALSNPCYEDVESAIIDRKRSLVNINNFEL
jgi:hypothetical protein